MKSYKFSVEPNQELREHTQKTKAHLFVEACEDAAVLIVVLSRFGLPVVAARLTEQPHLKVLGRRRLGEFERLRAYLPALQRETCVSNHENLVRGVFGSNVCYNLITDQTDVTIQFDSTGENSEKSGSV